MNGIISFIQKHNLQSTVTCPHQCWTKSYLCKPLHALNCLALIITSKKNPPPAIPRLDKIPKDSPIIEHPNGQRHQEQEENCEWPKVPWLRAHKSKKVSGKMPWLKTSPLSVWLVTKKEKCWDKTLSFFERPHSKSYKFPVNHSLICNTSGPSCWIKKQVPPPCFPSKLFTTWFQPSRAKNRRYPPKKVTMLHRQRWNAEAQYLRVRQKWWFVILYPPVN